MLTTSGWLVTLLLLVGTIALWGRVCRRHPANCTLVVLGLACFSAHVLAVFYQVGVPAEVVRALITVKDVFAAVLVVLLVWRAVRTSPRPRWLFLVVGLALLSALCGLVTGLGQWSTSDVALSIRNAAVPIEAALTGLLLSGPERLRVVRVGVWLVAVAAAAALVEYALPLSFVRDAIGVGQYWSDVKEQSYHLSPQGTGLPGNFFTSGGARRLSGTFGDPLSAGYAIAVALVAAVLARRSRWTWPVAGLLAVALLLTFTRGGWLIAAGALLPLLAASFLRRGWRERSLLVLAGVAAVAAMFAVPAFREYVDGILGGRDDSTRGHLRALLHVDDYDYSALGDGWGAAGGAVGRGTESVFVTVVLQTGLIGLVLYLGALAVLLVEVGRRCGAAGVILPFLGFVLAVLVTMLVSEQLLTFNAGWVLMLLAACTPAGRDGAHPTTFGVRRRGHATRGAVRK